jgi:hypothetical protein
MRHGFPERVFLNATACTRDCLAFFEHDDLPIA